MPLLKFLELDYNGLWVQNETNITMFYTPKILLYADEPPWFNEKNWINEKFDSFNHKSTIQ